MGIPLVPTMFEHSTKLRTLCLRSCWLIDDISFLGSLSNLEALSIVDCGLRRLPSMIGMLEKLKLLDLTGCVDLRIDDGVLQNLKSLKELYMRAYKNSRIMFTDANCDELEILSHQLFALELEFFKNKAQPKRVSFEKLERFRISIGCRLEELADDKKYSFKNTIKFVGDCNELLECKIRELFEKTEELHLQVNDIHHLKNIVSMHHSFSNLKVLHVSDCKELTYLFTVAMVSSLKKLERLEVSKCPAMRTLVDEDCTVGVIRFPKLNFMYLKKLQNMVSLCRTVIELPELVELKLDLSGGIQSLLNKEVVIPKLEKLEIDDMEQIWPYQISTDVKNDVSMMRVITVKMCSRLINIFPNNPLPMLNDLKELEVEDCGSIEVVFNIDFETVSEMDRYISRLRRNEVEYLCNLRELRRMRGVSNSSILINGFQGVQSIKIRGCNMFVTTNFDLIALINYIASEWNVKSEVEDYNIPDVTYLLHTCHHLTDLQLSDERVDQVVFECESINNVNEGGAPLRNITVVVVPQLSNLKSLSIIKCDRLPHIFTFSTLETLHHLKELKVNRCKTMQVIVKQENGTSSDCVALPRLETLELDDLPNLKGFFLGMNDFRWSSLTYVLIEDCPELMMFTSGQSTTPKLKYIQTRFGKYSSECGLNFHGTISQTTFPASDPTISKGMPFSFHNLIEINIKRKDVGTTIIPSHALRQLQKFQQIHLFDCKRVKEVFEVVASEGTNGSGFNASQTAVQIPNLTQVELQSLDHLKYLWKSNEWMLQDLKIKNCINIEVIVKEEEREEECDGKMNEIMLPRLNSLKLNGLPRLKGFCLGKEAFSLPLLETLEIKSCSALTVFTNGHMSTPELKGCEF
ncbi:hypothetical protein M8C21_016649 [Ambrosia artemisiifolia]|uniref:Disease resistance protein At4g27190-like leucine-rich repeats domain-containing protein n=1 Tax=Ambrosia artemisiifolia TaxID=4212 RepID=A0AAD5GL28_AMBAR|nr:hypothetical protein M8C21_016649 [Ambrosia artemisiifolia]